MEIEHELLGQQRDIADLKAEVNGLKESHNFIKEMIQRNTEVSEKLSDTLHEVEKSMVQMNQKMDAQTLTIDTMKKEMENSNKQLNERISNVKHQIEEVDNEGKFNIRTFFKNYLPWIIVVLGFGFFAVSKYIKF